MKVILAVVGITALVSTLSAGCRCVCMDGRVQPICSSSLDIKPICAPRICPIETPSVKPIQTPVVPPIGTKQCVKKYIYNDRTMKYEWKTVCY